MHKERYWGLATLSVIWFLAVFLMNASTGTTGMSAATAMWVLVAIYAIAGNISAVASIAKWVSILQITVGIIFFFMLGNNSSLQSYFGSPSEFALSIGIPTVIWISLYFWASEKAARQAVRAPNYDKKIINDPKKEVNSSIDFSIRKNYEAKLFDDSRNYTPPTKDQAAAAEILLQHDDQVRATIQDLAGLPKEVVDQVLIEIVNRLSENPQTVRNKALLVALGRPDM